MKRLLVVEDEAALRDVYVLLLKMHGFDVHEAANGQEALDQLDDIKPDGILLDALMPVMGGIEFLREANLNEKFPDTKVLLLTNLSDPKTIAVGQQLGAHQYLLKASCSPAELVDMVKKLLGL